MINPINNNGIIDYNNAKSKAQEAKQGEFGKALEKAMEEKPGILKTFLWKKFKELCVYTPSSFIDNNFQLYPKLHFWIGRSK